MTAMTGLIVGAIAFVGTHFLMSHPLRAPMVSALGEKVFGLVYVIVSFATLYLMVHFYHGAFADSPAVLWDAGSIGWIVGTILMWVGSVLFVGSLKSNPAFPTGGKPDGRQVEGRWKYFEARQHGTIQLDFTVALLSLI